MVKTAAERQRERRLRLKADPGQHQKYLKRDRERKNSARLSLSINELKKLRERTRLAVQKHRDEVRHTVMEENDHQIHKYGNKAALHKAKSRVLKALPKSPRKRRAVMKAVACDVLDAYVVTQPRRSLPQDVADLVLAYYQDDSVSRVMPGKADCISIRESTGNKIRKQKRTLVLTLSETYRCFRDDHPNISIGKSKFAELRPKWVLLSSETPHNACGCRYHENVILLAEALHRVYPDVVPLYSKQSFTARCVCSIDSDDCMSNNCETCRDEYLFNKEFRDVVVEKPEFKWYQWDEKNGFLQKVLKQGSTTDAFNELSKQLPKFFWHSFIKEKQSASYNESKKRAMSLDNNACLLQMDFAENFTCLWQDEIQSAHWKQKQVTVYTVMAYHHEKTLSYVIVSDYRDHEKNAVSAFTSHVLDRIKLEMPAVERVDIWTDGPSSQYKNKYVFALLHKLEEHHGFQIQWNYFATSHGKGPNDALGGNVKRMAHRLVMTRTNVINDAESFAKAIRTCDTTICIQAMDEAEILRKCQDLGTEALWTGLQTFQGTITTHFLKPKSRDQVEVKFYTSADRHRVLQVRRSGVDYTVSSAPADDIDAERPTSTCTPSPSQKTMQIKLDKHNINLCKYCGFSYGQTSDPKVSEDWIQCRCCSLWTHESCGEDNGIIDDDELYTCADCL